MTCVSVVSGGRTHFARGENYVGSVNSYNNWLTKLVTKILRLSMTVTICGEKHRVNKKSYKKLLVAVGTEESVKVGNYKTILQLGYSSHQGNIRDHISQKKQAILSVKLASAIMKKDEDEAIKLIYQGADLERKYHQIGEAGISFSKLQKVFNPDMSFKVEVVTGTPWIHANHQGLARVKGALMAAGADQTKRGERYDYKQKIRAIRRSRTLGITPAFGIGFTGPFCGMAIGVQNTATPIHTRERKNINHLRYS